MPDPEQVRELAEQVEETSALLEVVWLSLDSVSFGGIQAFGGNAYGGR